MLIIKTNFHSHFKYRNNFLNVKLTNIAINDIDIEKKTIKIGGSTFIFRRTMFRYAQKCISEVVPFGGILSRSYASKPPNIPLKGGIIKSIANTTADVKKDIDSTISVNGVEHYVACTELPDGTHIVHNVFTSTKKVHHIDPATNKLVPHDTTLVTKDVLANGVTGKDQYMDSFTEFEIKAGQAKIVEKPQITAYLQQPAVKKIIEETNAVHIKISPETKTYIEQLTEQAKKI